jgi:hypothetical protein
LYLFCLFCFLDIYYDEAGSLFNRPLILVKELKSPFDIRYKSDYFPRGGKNAGIPQPPRYLQTVDGQQEIIIKVNYILTLKISSFRLRMILVSRWLYNSSKSRLLFT